MKVQNTIITLTLLGALLFSPSLILAELSDKTFCTLQFDDWKQTDDPDSLCLGYYVPAPTPSFAEKNSAITISSDTAGFKNLESSFSGHVHAQQRYREIYADQINILRKNNEFHLLKATGDITIIEPGLRLDATEANVFIQDNKADLKNAYFRIYERHARGFAERLKVPNTNQLHLDNASYTTCAPGKAFWALHAKSFAFNKKIGTGVAHHATLRIYDVPVIYTPYISFPIDKRRKTGFLYPTPSVTKRSGFRFKAPFYLNIAPNYDATITPNFLSKRGTELQSNFHYLSLHHNGKLQYHILPNDKAYQKFKIEKQQNPYIPKSDRRFEGLGNSATRYGLNLKHNYHLEPHWSSQIDYNRVSDDNYFADLGEDLDTSNTTELLQKAQLNYQDYHWDVIGVFQQHNPLFPYDGAQGNDTYRLLPQISFLFHPLELDNGITFSTKGQVSRFRHNFITDNTTGNRFLLRPAIAYPIVYPGWYIKPRVQVNMISYNLKPSLTEIPNQKPQNPTQISPMLDIDSGLIFERKIQLKNQVYTQTLEPRLYFLQVPHRKQDKLPVFDTNESSFEFNQLFRDNRFTGYDRLGDANQTTLGLTSRLFESKTGIEQFYVSIGQIFYFQSRKVHLSHIKHQHHSDYALQAMYHMNNHWHIYFDYQWDPYRKRSDKNALIAQYLPNKHDVFNIGYQYLRTTPLRKPHTHQGYFSFAKQVHLRWRIIGKHHHDFKRNLAQRSLLGAEYEGCCGAIRFMISRFLQPNSNPATRQYDTGLYLQLVFKGLAGVGVQGMDAEIQREMPGYAWHERFS